METQDSIDIAKLQRDALGLVHVCNVLQLFEIPIGLTSVFSGARTIAAIFFWPGGNGQNFTK